MIAERDGHSVWNGKQRNAKALNPSCHVDSNVNRRRLIGEYYTPDSLAAVLAEWAITSRIGTVLDPSFGGCAFMNAAARVLAGKGVSEPGKLVFGVDVESKCLEYVRSSRDLIEANCTVRDFLDLSREELQGAPFQAVIGNPPYVRHHWLNRVTKAAGRAANEGAGIALSGRASAWAYFVVHSMNFIATNGRLALLVPEAILQADYANVVRELLISSFGNVRLVHLRERMFEGTEEAVVAVAASGFGEKQGILRVDTVDRFMDLKAALEIKQVGHSSPHVVTSKGRRIDSLTLKLLSELEQRPTFRKISDFATVRIGIVTGANKHFIRTAGDLKRRSVPPGSWVRVVSRTRWLTGLEFTENDLQELVDADRQAILVWPTLDCEESLGIQQWISEGKELGVHEAFKCTIRDSWFRVALQRVPDAFATCTRNGAPLLILNRADCLCTNALHAMYWHSKSENSRKAIAVGFLTSAVSVWSELHGRRYGGGILKIEPRTLNETLFPLVDGAEDTFDELDGLIRSGRESEARKRADDVVLGDLMGLDKGDVRLLQAANARLAIQRHPVGNGTDHG